MCCLGPVGGFGKLWTARPWPVEHVGGRGQQERVAGEGPLGALSMSINARSGATVGQLPRFPARWVCFERGLPPSVEQSAITPAEALSRPGAGGPIFCPRMYSCSAKCLCPAFCCHQRISCDEECRFGVVQDPEVRANESGFAMPPKERSDGAG